MNPYNLLYPFGSRLSLKPLIDFWIKTTGSQSPGCKSLAESLRNRLALCPELTKPIENVSILDGHHDLLQDLMSAIFPTALWESSIIAAMVPYTLEPVWLSPRFDRLLIDEHGRLSGIEPGWTGDFKKAQISQAYRLVLRACYGINAGDNPSLIHSIEDPDTGLIRYFRLKSDFRFTTVHVKDAAFKTLGKDQKAAVLDNMNEPEKLRAVLPPEKFEFQGFVVLDAVDVTESQVISQLSMDLINKDSVMHQERFF